MDYQERRAKSTRHTKVLASAIKPVIFLHNGVAYKAESSEVYGLSGPTIITGTQLSEAERALLREILLEDETLTSAVEMQRKQSTAHDTHR